MTRTLAVTIAVLMTTMAFAKTEATKISRERARTIALQKAKGTVASEELEREHGKLVWSFDIRTSKTDITEVLVDANDGSIVSIEHETPAKEKAEQAKEHKH